MLYNLILLLGAVCHLPKWLLQSKYRGTIAERLGFVLPPKSNTIPTIWIHAVSIGETRAVFPIYERLKRKYPSAAFYFSTMTKTGLEQAKKLYPDAICFFLPIDFSWNMNRLTRHLKPDYLILSEGDFWLNLITSVKAQGGKVIVLNGKISERSSVRYAKVPNFSQKLFQRIDHLCIQNAKYAARFHSLCIPPKKISVTGNLKLSIVPQALTPAEKDHWRKEFGLTKEDLVITVGSTHKNEEKLLLPHLKHAKVLLVPRHPERFEVVKKFLEKNDYPNVRLVDQMGILNTCYQLSHFAIVGGSFVPEVGGHNIFEPIQVGIPVLFGPYMHTQPDLVSLVLSGKAGIQTSVEQLPAALEQAPSLTENARILANQVLRVADTTWNILESNILQ